MRKGFAITVVGLLALLVVLLEVAFVQSSAAQGRPTPTPALSMEADEPAAPASPDALPDLIVEKIELTPPDPYVGRDAIVSVTIKNIGAADVAEDNNFFLDLYINPTTDQLRGIPGDFYWGIQGYWMKVGKSVTLSQVLTGVFTDAVSYNLWAQVDTPDLPAPRPTGWVLESDEDNNILGPKVVHGRTHYAWVQKDHVDFFENMASTLDVVPAMGTVGIITNTPALELGGDSALALGIFQEPPTAAVWGLTGPLSDDQMLDYNMINPDTRVNQEVAEYQVFPSVHASGNLVVAVWEDGRNGPTFGRDIFLRWSDDSGESWKPEFRVNDVSINDQRHPKVAVAPNGTIVVAWQDHRGESFDIYVQAFVYSDESLDRCHANGDCSTPCSGTCNFRVDTDANNQDQILPDIDVDDENNFYIAWQDRRNGNDDIFAVRSYTSTVECPSNRMALRSALDNMVESSLSPDATTWLCWADDTRIDDDPSTTKQSAPSINALRARKVVDIVTTYFCPPAAPPVLVVLDIKTEDTTYVAAVWEDWREGDADIYFTVSDDDGETFGVDQRLNKDKAPNTADSVDQLVPDVAINSWMKQKVITQETPCGLAEGYIDVPATTMHIVWQDFRHSTDAAKTNDPDIYHTAMTMEPDGPWPWPITLKFEDERQVNTNDERAWQTGPVWQGEPRVHATGSALSQVESNGWNAYVVWADGRNYGGEFGNTDIYFQFLSNIGDKTDFIPANNLMLNDGAHLHAFDPDVYTSYRPDMPPHARQRNPDIASTLLVEWPSIFPSWHYTPQLAYDPYVFVVWDDDRRADPFSDRDVYIARTNLLYGGRWEIFDNPLAEPPGEDVFYASGAFVSSVFDAGRPDTTWYIVDWHATTDLGTYITLQTRIGNTREEVLAGDWYPNDGFPYPDDALSKGAPLLGYDAPGQHIEDAGGNYWPEARYIQYRVNFWARNTVEPDPDDEEDDISLNTPFLFDVILHYERPATRYLPLVLRQFRR